jgi:hypothetical protein
MARFVVVVSLVRSLTGCLIAVFPLTTAQAQFLNVGDRPSPGRLRGVPLFQVSSGGN